MTACNRHQKSSNVIFLICIRLKVLASPGVVNLRWARDPPLVCWELGSTRFCKPFYRFLSSRICCYSFFLNSECFLNPLVAGWKIYSQVMTVDAWRNVPGLILHSKAHRHSSSLVCLQKCHMAGRKPKEAAPNRSTFKCPWCPLAKLQTPNSPASCFDVLMFGAVRSRSQFQRPVVVSNLVERPCSSRTADVLCIHVWCHCRW